MSHDVQTVTGLAPSSGGSAVEHTGKRLGAFLCWAVVFADIGTSVYYVPGILFSQIGRLAGLFVVMTLVVFLLLTLKYAEVSSRFPEGGGVVTVSARGLNPWAGAVGGMFILVDYFLTSAISSLSGLQYFTAVLPGITPYVMIITLVVLVLLGVLNWWGIKESAIVSAVIAVAAFASDIAILIVVFVNVPLSTIALVFEEMFTGRHVGGLTLLTGFAAAFLAFSGLESISQLSPVMRTPRHKTVSAALAIVVITVGITSPLLTIFSTTLLDATKADPNKFISELAGAYGGPVLSVLTAITASTLLVFASNTAIIGAYHVFLALSRMQFFPSIIERHDRWRDTPYVSISLATGIPILVLIAVQGRIDTLGDMYAFGLLGAFSLTSVALDVIRWRERHGEPHIGDQEDQRASAHRDPSTSSGSQVSITTGESTPPRLRRARDLLLSGMWALINRSRLWWPNVKFYLGLLTSFLVLLAWVTNLVHKRLATEFGGGLTLLGVSIAVVHYRWQQRKGRAMVFPSHVLRRVPGSLLVLLSAESPNNEVVIRSVRENAAGRPAVFLYLAQRTPQVLQLMQIADPYLYDKQAQHLFSEARAVCARADIPATFIYRIGGPSTVADAWQVIRPDEIIADASVARAISSQVSPEYVRFQVVNGVRIAHYVRHQVSALDTPGGGGFGPGSSLPGRRLQPPRQTGPGATPRTKPTPPTSSDRSNISSEKPSGGGQPEGDVPERGVAEPAGEPQEQPHARPDEKPEEQGSSDITDYVWTGTKLVRRDEVERDDNESDDDNG